MSPAQQRGLALWASLLSALVCLLFLPVPRWGAWLILLVTLALIIGIWRIASRRTGRNVASTLDPLPEGAYRQLQWSSFAATCRVSGRQRHRCESSNRAAGSAWKRRRSCSRSRARY